MIAFENSRNIDIKSILFIFGCSLIALGLGEISITPSLEPSSAKSAVPQAFYWLILTIEKIFGKYTIPTTGLLLVAVSFLMRRKDK